MSSSDLPTLISGAPANKSVWELTEIERFAFLLPKILGAACGIGIKAEVQL